MIAKYYKKYGYFILLLFLGISLLDMRVGSIAIICMFAPLLFAILGKGRYWCGNYCPRGNFYHQVISKISPKRKVPKFLKSIGFRLFMVAFIIFNFARGIYHNWGNLTGIGMVFYRIIAITTIVGILLAFFYQPRTWCNFCPMGTLSYLIAKLRGRSIHLAVESSCVSCGLCTKTCPMGLSPKDYKDGQLTDSNCIFCKECVYKCPKKSIQ